jgi:hypothetical protein
MLSKKKCLRACKLLGRVSSSSSVITHIRILGMMKIDGPADQQEGKNYSLSIKLSLCTRYKCLHVITSLHFLFFSEISSINSSQCSANFLPFPTVLLHQPKITYDLKHGHQEVSRA